MTASNYIYSLKLFFNIIAAVITLFILTTTTASAQTPMCSDVFPSAINAPATQPEVLTIPTFPSPNDGDLNLNNNANFNQAPGTFYYTSLSTGQNVNINISDPTILFIQGSASFGNKNTINNTGAPEDLIIIASGTISIGNRVEMKAILYAEGAITIGNNTDFLGAITARGAASYGKTAPIYDLSAVEDADFDGLCLQDSEPPELLVEWRMDEVSWGGITGEVTDTSGNIRHATPINGATTEMVSPAILGNPGTCRYGAFDGDGQYIEDSDAGQYLNGLTAVTALAWIRNTDSIGHDRGIFTTGNPNANDNRFGLRYDVNGASSGNNNLLKASINTDACVDNSDCLQVETIGGLQTLDEWQHVAMTWSSGNKIRIYIDGVEAETEVTNSGIGSHAGTLDGIDFLRVGQSTKSGTPTPEWQGNIDEFRIYDQALDVSLIAQIMNETHPCIIPVAEYRFDLCSETDTVFDDSGNGFDGSVINGPLTIKEGKICNGAYFDGVDDYVQVDDADVFDNTSKLTIAGWINPESIYDPPEGTNARGIISKRDNASSNVSYGIFFYSSKKDGKLYIDLDTTNNRFSSNSVIPEDDWTHFAVVFDGDLAQNERAKLYLNGELDKTAPENSETIPDYDSDLYIGNLYYGLSELKVYQGMLDELRVMPQALSIPEIQALYNDSRSGCQTCSQIDHFEFIHDGQGLTCAAETVKLKACTNADCSKIYTGTSEITLPDLGWLYGAVQNINFDPDGEVDLILKHTTAEEITLEVLSANPAAANPAVCNNGTEASCIMTFADSGFILEVDDGRSCTDLSGTIQAVQKDDETNLCIGADSFADTTRDVGFWFNYADPSSGTINPFLDETELNQTETATTTDLSFNDKALAEFNLSYADAGSLNLFARFEGNSSNIEEGLIMTGSTTEAFVLAPHHFEVTSPLNNSSSSGSTTVIAAELFEATITAVCENGGTTPNFAAQTTLSAETPSDPDDNLGTLSNVGLSQVDYNNGEANPTDLSYDEVGNFTLKAESTDYLSSGMDINGTAVVGRFIPHHFQLSQGSLNNRSELGCAIRPSFTYLDENLEFAYDLTAINAAGGITENYVDAFAKLEGETTSADYIIGASGNNPDGSTTDLTSRLDIINVSRVADWANGNADFSVKLNVDRLAQTDGPFIDTIFGVFVRDSDEVEIEPLDLDVDNDSNNDYAQAAENTLLRYGRIKLDNAHGSELLDLPMQLHAEYWNGDAFILNDLDNCTILTETDFALTNEAGTSVSGTNPIEVGGGKSTSASINNQPLNAGDADLFFSAPGEEGDGWIDVDLSVPEFLQYDWNGDGTYDESPTARATFGIFKGNEHIIYLRETTWR